MPGQCWVVAAGGDMSVSQPIPRSTPVLATECLQMGSRSLSLCDPLAVVPPSGNNIGCITVQEKLMRILSVQPEESVDGGGRNALQKVVDSGDNFTKEQAWDILGKLITDLRIFIDQKVNVHKRIKNQIISIEGIYETLQMLGNPEHITPVIAKQTASLPAAELIDTGSEAGGAGESIVEGKNSSDPKIKRFRERGSPNQVEAQVNNSPLLKSAKNNVGNKEAMGDWNVVVSKKELKRRKKELLQNKQSEQQQLLQKPQSDLKWKKSQKLLRPDAIVIRPTDKAKYVDILRRIKQEVPYEQARANVDKIYKTKSGDMLITLLKRNTDKGQAFQKTITNILKDEAKVGSKGPQEEVEIRDIDESTTKEDIHSALQMMIGENYTISLENIKIRSAHRGTQTAVVILPVSIVREKFGDKGRIRIGWVNCRYRIMLRPKSCYKCWHFGHIAAQCTSLVNRSKLCMKCGQKDHLSAKCQNTANCLLCTEKSGSQHTAHKAGSGRCPIFQKALQKLRNI
uniref:CCHC-type domain-containing protein n=1 Tax=Xenopsylla cheopis TaxID=163159 RepID=A0A6M2DR74_XENCH